MNTFVPVSEKFGSRNFRPQYLCTFPSDLILVSEYITIEVSKLLKLDGFLLTFLSESVT